MSSTPRQLIAIVVCTLAFLSALYVGTLAWCVIRSLAPDPVLLAAFGAVGGSIVGTFTGMLINTRSAPTDAVQKETTVSTMSAPNPEPLPDAKKDIATP